MNETMNEMKFVKEYWNQQSKYYIWDDYVLRVSIESLDEDERNLITKDVATLSPDDQNRYHFIMYRIFNRHFDVINGRTEIMMDDDGKKYAVYTKKSSLTELDISYSTFVNCYQSAIFKIEDIERPMVSTMTLESTIEIMKLLMAMGAIKDIKE